MSVATERRRNSKQERRSRTVHVLSSVWDDIQELIEDGTYVNVSHATEEALKRLSDAHAEKESRRA